MSNPDHPLTTAGVDLDALINRLGGDETMVPLLCAIFVEDAPRLIERLQAAREARDLAAIVMAAHAIKGAISNFTSGPLFASAASVERHAKRGDADEACDRAADLGSEVRAFAEALATVQTPAGFQ